MEGRKSLARAPCKPRAFYALLVLFLYLSRCPSLLCLVALVSLSLFARIAVEVVRGEEVGPCLLHPFMILSALFASSYQLPFPRWRPASESEG